MRLLAITPEYGDVKRAQGKSYGTQPTFTGPPPMPLEFKTIAGVKSVMRTLAPPKTHGHSC